MKVTDCSTKNPFLLDNSTTRAVACGREVELMRTDFSSIIRVWELACHHFYHWTDVRYNRKQAIKEVTTWCLWEAECKTALAESSNSSEVMWGVFSLTLPCWKGGAHYNPARLLPTGALPVSGKGNCSDFPCLMDPPCGLDIANLLQLEIMK